MIELMSGWWSISLGLGGWFVVCVYRLRKVEKQRAAAEVEAEIEATVLAVESKFKSEIQGVADCVSEIVECLALTMKKSEENVENLIGKCQHICQGVGGQTSELGTVRDERNKAEASVDSMEETLRQESQHMISIFAEEATKTATISLDIMASMEEAEKSASNIAGVITEIEYIADQTKLVALNAAIEAARAGDHGLGFAFVAQEVTSLAVRATKFSNQIHQLVDAVKENTNRATFKLGNLSSIDLQKGMESQERFLEASEILLRMNSQFHKDMLERRKELGVVTDDLGQIMETLEAQDRVGQQMLQMRDILSEIQIHLNGFMPRNAQNQHLLPHKRIQQLRASCMIS